MINDEFISIDFHFVYQNLIELEKSVKKRNKMLVIIQDQKKIKVELDVAKQIGLLNDMNEFFEEGSNPVPLNDVASKELKKCIAFCKRQLTKKSVEGQVSAWDRRFFDVERNDFFGKSNRLKNYIS